MFRKFVSYLSLLLVTTNAFANPPIIWGANNSATLLTNKLTFLNGQNAISNSAFEATTFSATEPPGLYILTKPTQITSGSVYGSHFVQIPQIGASTVTGSSYYPVLGYATVNGATSVTNNMNVFGMRAASEITGASIQASGISAGLNTSGSVSGVGTSVNQMQGSRNIVTCSSGAVCSSLVGMDGLVQVLGSSTVAGATVASAIGMRARYLTTTGSAGNGTITDGIGILISASNSSNITNHWGIQVVDPLQRNYFMGRTLVGTSWDDGVNMLQLTGNAKITGNIASYNGQVTEGNGVASVVKYVGLTGQTASIGSTTLFTPAEDGIYEFGCYTVTTTTSAGSMALNGAWTDDAQAQSGDICNITSTAVKDPESNVFTIQAKAGTAISYSTTLVGTATYSLYITLKRIK